MSDFSSPTSIVLPTHISTLSRYACGFEARELGVSSSLTARTWVSGLAAYLPFAIPWPYPVHRVFWVNGSTISSTNVNFGIFDEGGTQVYSTGATAMVGASALQYVSVATPFVLPARMYYFAWTCNGTTNRGWTVSGTANTSRLAGLLEETSAYPLPATMTPVAFTRAWGPNLCGITRTSSGY